MAAVVYAKLYKLILKKVLKKVKDRKVGKYRTWKRSKYEKIQEVFERSEIMHHVLMK